MSTGSDEEEDTSLTAQLILSPPPMSLHGGPKSQRKTFSSVRNIIASQSMAMDLFVL